MSRFVITAVGLLLFQIASAQFCGTDQEALQPFLDANLKAMVPSQRGALKYVPVTFHLVANAAGNGRVDEENVLKQVANFNSQYADQEFIFYIDHFNFFDNDAVYNSPSSTAARTQMRLRKDNNSINIFICNTADDGSGPGTTLAYFDPQEDWIVTRKNEVNGASPTLAHEVGHFFSLAHTHAGWDCVPYTLDDYTNPVNVNSTLPCEGGGGSILIELHDRSNCATAGDKICDTPEDYNLGLFFQPGCEQNTVVKDKNGEVIKPQVDNFMSYYMDCPSRQFTPTQKTLINTDYFSAHRIYIRTAVIPNTTPVPGPVTYISPIGGQESNGLSNILLDWEDEPGANKYLVIYDRFSSFTFDPKKAIVSASQYIIPDALPEGVTYYWKVWPYNESQTGAMYSPAQNFKVSNSSAVNEITEVQDFVLSPNPVRNNVTTTLSLNTIKAFDAVLKIVDASGRVISTQKVNIPSGFTHLPINTIDLTSGVYFVVLQANSGNLVERMLITE